MFEFEVNHATYAAAEIPEDIQAEFAESRGIIKTVSLLAWEEHCTECAMPQCYSTCDLYEPRKDGKCRRFQFGFGYVGEVPSVFGYLTKVAFKRWGQIMAYANIRQKTIADVSQLEGSIVATDRLVAKIPDGKLAFMGRSGISSRLRRRYKQKIARTPSASDVSVLPDCFMVETYNPENKPIALSLTIRAASGQLSARPYQNLLQLEPGFNRFRIAFHALAPHIDDTLPFHITLCPNLLNPAEEGLALYFGLIGFVTEYNKINRHSHFAQSLYTPGELEAGQKYVKVIAWDLDNTLWNGILVEDGEQNLQLKDGIAEVIRELDRRGIVNSIVSKNNSDAVMPILDKLNLRELFVFPKISWNPKSTAVLELIADFNVGADAIAVIDDSDFERSEISARCNGVRVYKEDIYSEMLELPEFMPPISNESAKRRGFYRAEELRISNQEAFGDDYLRFLRSCNMRVLIERADIDNIDRVHELIQRTNQLNYSGNRYSREHIAGFLDNPQLLPICVTCADKFGDYGLVGFCLLDIQRSEIKDIMFSCRVQSKRVEHALLCELMKFQKAHGVKQLGIKYKKTPKNTPAARIFDDLSFTLEALADDNVSHTFSYDLAANLPEQDIVFVEWRVGL